MKVKARVEEIFEFEVEITESMSRREILEKIEVEWNKIVSVNLEGEFFQESEYNFDYL